MTSEINVSHFDNWFEDTGPAAVVLIEHLQPVAEGESVIFPPTYMPEKSVSDRKSEYVIDPLKDGRKLCQIDSVGSQANRMEPIFKNPPYDKLVPQVTVEVGDRKVNLLDAGHRAADAIMRFSSLSDDLASAFQAWLKGDASKLADVAPTTLVFGAWDSRGTQAKAPRIVSSIIRAYDVDELTRSATYIPPVNYVDMGVVSEELAERDKGEKRTDSQLGLVHATASRVLGGVVVRGGIRREATLNLVALRTVGVPQGNGKLDESKTKKLRRYILGLSLVALTKPMSHNLRQGCLLVGIENKPADWKLVHPSGKRESFALSHDTALKYAEKAADEFGVKTKPIEGKFDPKLAKAEADDKTKQKEAKKASKKNAKA
jgi:CRISPR-associated protein Csb1